MKVRLEVLCDLPHQPLEWQFSDKECGRLLVMPDLTQGHNPQPEPSYPCQMSLSSCLMCLFPLPVRVAHILQCFLPGNLFVNGMKVQYWLLPIYIQVSYHLPQARAGILYTGLEESRKLAVRLLSFPLACTFARWLGDWSPLLSGVLCQYFFCLRCLVFHGGIPLLA